MEEKNQKNIIFEEKKINNLISKIKLILREN